MLQLTVFKTAYITNPLFQFKYVYIFYFFIFIIIPLQLYSNDAENIRLLKEGRINYAFAEWWLNDTEPLNTDRSSLNIGINYSKRIKKKSYYMSIGSETEKADSDNIYTDTSALQAALSSGAEFVTVSDIGRPWITEPLFLESNQTVFFDRGVIIEAEKGRFRNKGDKLISAVNKENISLYGHGAVLRMRRSDYTYPPYEEGQWRHCLSFAGCRDITVKGLSLEDSGGDGVYIGSGGKRGAYNYCRNVVIEEVKISGHYRQGISVISAENILIKNCIIENTGNHSPSAGIDFEPNNSEERIINCIVENNIIRNNFGPGILFFLANFDKETLPVSVILKNNKAYTNRRPLSIRNISKGRRGTIILDNNLFIGFKGIDPSNRNFKIITR